MSQIQSSDMVQEDPGTPSPAPRSTSALIRRESAQSDSSGFAESLDHFEGMMDPEYLDMLQDDDSDAPAHKVGTLGSSSESEATTVSAPSVGRDRKLTPQITISTATPLPSDEEQEDGEEGDFNGAAGNHDQNANYDDVTKHVSGPTAAIIGFDGANDDPNDNDVTGYSCDDDVTGYSRDDVTGYVAAHNGDESDPCLKSVPQKIEFYDHGMEEGEGGRVVEYIEIRGKKRKGSLEQDGGVPKGKVGDLMEFVLGSDQDISMAPSDGVIQKGHLQGFALNASLHTEPLVEPTNDGVLEISGYKVSPEFLSQTESGILETVGHKSVLPETFQSVHQVDVCSPPPKAHIVMEAGSRSEESTSGMESADSGSRDRSVSVSSSFSGHTGDMDIVTDDEFSSSASSGTEVEHDVILPDGDRPEVEAEGTSADVDEERLASRAHLVDILSRSMAGDTQDATTSSSSSESESSDNVKETVSDILAKDARASQDEVALETQTADGAVITIIDLAPEKVITKSKKRKAKKKKVPTATLR